MWSQRDSCSGRSVTAFLPSFPLTALPTLSVCLSVCRSGTVNIEDPDAVRVPIVSRNAGIVFGLRRHKLARPGEICIKVAGDDPLPWRTGNLLTSR